MKKIIAIGTVLLILSINVKAIKVRFTVANMSVNVAEGSIGVFASFQIYPNNFVQQDSTDFIKLIDFPAISYDVIQEAVIEKTLLTTDATPNFVQLTSFAITDSVGFGHYSDADIVQGSSYAYRLAVITNTGQQLNLTQKSTSTEIAYPLMNCAKLNNIYRKACHNCFQPSIMAKNDGGLYQALFSTRVVELDIWKPSSTPIAWEVRHTAFPLWCSGNCNNCGYNTSTGQADGDKIFRVCLSDIAQWHTDYPNHDPIIIHVDLKSDFDWPSQHTPEKLDQFLKDAFGVNNIYKPRDFLGNNFGDMRRTAHRNNWPSMGDLTGKFIIVLTGDGSKLSQYIADRQLSAVAFSAASVVNQNDVDNLPSILTGLKSNIVFYNMQQFDNSLNPYSSDADFNTGYYTSNLGYINRTYGIGFWGQPGEYDDAKYAKALNFQMNNVAVANITNTFNPSYTSPYLFENGIQWLPDVTYPAIVNDTITSSYANVTQAAIFNIVATDLIVETGTHYRMIANNTIDLQPGVDFQPGSDVDVRIDDCTNTASYTLRQSAGEPLTQDEIDALMHELDKELYGYTPQDEEEMIPSRKVCLR